MQPTFDDTFPNLQITDDLFPAASLEALVDVILEALEKPLPLDEESLVAALTLVSTDFSEDERVTNIFDQLRQAVVVMDGDQEEGDEETLNRRGSLVTSTEVITLAE